MKKIIYLTFLSCFFFSNKGNSQITNLQILDSTHCNNGHIGIYFTVDAVAETNPVFTINWGDGNSTQLPSNTYAANQFFAEESSHAYTQAGTYVISVSVVSSVNSQTINSNTITVNVYSVNECGYIYPETLQTNVCGVNSNLYLYNVAYDLIGNDGTILNFNGNAFGLNINNIPYQLSINDIWLANNNLTQTSSDVIITGFDPVYHFPIFATNSSFTVQSTLPSSTVADLSFNYCSGIGASASQNARVYLHILNATCFTNPNVNVSLEFPNFLIPDLTSLTNASVTGNILTFEINSMENYHSQYLNFFMPGTTPAGTILNFTCTLTDLGATETNTANNTLIFSGLVYNSYDPNDKLVNKPTNINPNEAEELQYTINFQNEGNFDALRVQVIDTLSENLDLSTFKVLDTKHDVVTSLDPNTRVVKFTFNDIYLAPSSQDIEASKGQILYSIKENLNLSVNSEIKNTAYIYFDFNPAIITNTTLNVNSILGLNSIENENTVSIYPNPIKDEINIESNTKIKSVNLYNTNGKVVFSSQHLNNGKISVSKFQNGIYFLKIETENGFKTEKISILND